MHSCSRFFELIDQVKSESSRCVYEDSIAILECSIKIFGAIRRKDDNDIATFLSELFVLCVRKEHFESIKNQEYKDVLGERTKNEFFYTKLKDYFRDRLGHLLSSGEYPSFILDILFNMGIPPLKCVEEYLSDGNVVL